MGIILMEKPNIVSSSKQHLERAYNRAHKHAVCLFRCGILESARSPDQRKNPLWRPLASKSSSAKSFVSFQDACK
jgi:hypothetical protein